MGFSVGLDVTDGFGENVGASVAVDDDEEQANRNIRCKAGMVTAFALGLTDVVIFELPFTSNKGAKKRTAARKNHVLYFTIHYTSWWRQCQVFLSI